MNYKLIFFFLLISITASAKKFTLVVDAGHGGHDAGAVGAVTKEKNLTLKFALAFGQMVERNCPDVKVVYTRKTDKFIPLWQRAEIANNNKADLFVSVHINAVPGRRPVRGFQTYTLGRSKRTGKTNGVDENLEVAKRENAVIYLEDNYQQTYHGYDPNSPESNIMFEFIQDKNMESSIELAKYMQRYVCQATGRKDLGAQQDNLAVLRLSSMPSCLVELGFISTRDEEQYMNSAKATSDYARGMFNAFLAYRKHHGESMMIPFAAPKPTAAPAPSDTISSPSISFKVQILSGTSLLKAGASQFKGLKDVSHFQENGLYKYTIGDSSDYQAIYRLRKQILPKFPEAFIIAFRGDQRMDVNEAIREWRANK